MSTVSIATPVQNGSAAKPESSQLVTPPETLSWTDGHGLRHRAKLAATRYLKSWAFVDAVTLGLALGLGYAYVVYDAGLPESGKPSWLVFWPNVVTDLFAAFVSLRIIERWISARAEKPSVRRTLLGNLDYMYRVAADLNPTFYRWRVTELQNELSWFADRSHSRGRFLARDEQQHVQAAYAIGLRVLELARVVTAAADHIQEIERHLKLLYDREPSENSVLTLSEVRAYGRIRVDYEFLRDWNGQITSDVTSRLTQAERQLEDELSALGPKLPPEAPSLLREYLAEVKRLCEARRNVATGVEELRQALRVCRTSIELG